MADWRAHADWQPIATGPKDGSRVLLFWPRLGVTTEGIFYSAKDGDEFWYSSNANTKASDNPSHWMPLPPNPQS